MSDDDDSADEVLTIILRRDGSLRYDLMRQDHLEDLLPPEALKDPGVETILELSSKGVFNPMREPLGNIGLDLFATSRDRLSAAQKGIGISNSSYATPLVQAIGLTISDLERREPRAIAAEELVQDLEGSATILHDIMELEIFCNQAGSDDANQEKCRQIYWKLWEFAWARRIFVPENHIIETLENIYSRHPFLDTRLGERRTLAPPGEMHDPREEEDMEPELF